MLINEKPLKMYKEIVDKPVGHYYLLAPGKLDIAQKYCFKVLQLKSFSKERKKIPYGVSLVWMHITRSAPFINFEIQKIED